MIHTFEDLCLYTYVIVDDIWQQIGSLFHRPGPAPDCSDSELITIALLSECRGWDTETELLDHWTPYLALFPHFPERSRFNRRRRNLTQAIDMLRRRVLQDLDLSQDPHCIIDSLPVPVVAFHLVPDASREWGAYGADFGKVPSKKQTIFGYKLHLLITLSGVIRDFELAPASASDLAVGAELLSQHTHLTVLADKAYISAAVAETLQQRNGMSLVTLRRANQHAQLPKSLTHLINQVRQLIETVNQQLTDQFHIARNRAHTFYGLVARLRTKLAANTLCIYINRLLGKADVLHIKQLAFPNI